MLKIKTDLAHAYQILSHLKMDDHTYTHLSARADESDQYYIYPFGLRFEDVVAEAEPGKKTSGKSTIYEKPGGYKEALDDFESLGPNDIVPIDKGKRGVLDDGRDINVRGESTDKRPTLEVQRGRKKIKIRYGNK